MSLLAFTATRALRASPPSRRGGRATRHDRPVGRPLSLQCRPNRSQADHGGSIPRPAGIPGATWQAGVTPGNENLKVLLDGEPCRDAIAASDVDGWVVVQTYGDLEDGTISPFHGGTKRLAGRVTIVRGDAA